MKVKSLFFCTLVCASSLLAQTNNIGTPVTPKNFAFSVYQTTTTPTLPYSTVRAWDAPFHAAWAYLNQCDNTYSWGQLDAWTSLNAGKDLIYTFGIVPDFAASDPSANTQYPLAGGYACTNADGTPNGQSSLGGTSCSMPNITAWDKFVTAIATHSAAMPAGQVIKFWELWNEPMNYAYWCHGTSGTAFDTDAKTHAQFALMAEHASKIIKTLIPDAQILAPSTDKAFGLAWLDNDYANLPACTTGYTMGCGTQIAWDIMAIHGYSDNAPEGIVAMTSQYAVWNAAHGSTGIPIWDTEVALSSTPTAQPTDYVFLARLYVLSWSSGIARTLWYGYDHLGAVPLVDSSLALTADGIAYQQTYNWLVGATMTAACSQDGNGTYTCPITRPGGYQGLIAWNSTSTVSMTPSAGMTQYRDLTGGKTQVSGPVSVANSPILLEMATTTYTVVLDENAGLYPAHRSGIGGYGDNYYSALQQNNILQSINPSLQPTHRAEMINVESGTVTTFTSLNHYSATPANYMAGDAFTVRCHGSQTVCSGGATGETGIIDSNTTGTYQSSGPTFTMRSCVAPGGGACTAALGFEDIVSVSGQPTSSTVAATGWATGGNGVFSMDSTPADQPAKLYGMPVSTTQVLQLVNPSGGYSYIKNYIDSVPNQLNYAFQGTYQVSFSAKVISGTGLTVEGQAQRSGGALNVDATATLAGSGWQNYSITSTTNASETTATAPGTVAITFLVQGQGTLLLSGLSITPTTHTNPSSLRDDAIARYKLGGWGGLRYNFLTSITGCTLLDLLQPQQFRPPCESDQSHTGAYVYPSLVGWSLPEFLSAAKAAGMDTVTWDAPVWWSTSEDANLADYLRGGCGTVYGGYRCAQGHTAPWDADFASINLVYGNEPWNNTTPGVYFYPNGQGNNYFPMATQFCAALKASPSWNPATETCVASTQAALDEQGAALIAAADPGHVVDAQAVSDYYQQAITSDCTPSTFYLSAIVNAWANSVDPAMDQYRIGHSGLKTVQYEAAPGSNSGKCTAAQLPGQVEGEGQALSDVLEIAYLQRANPGKYNDYNYWEICGLNSPFASTAPSNPATTIPIWGAFNGCGGAYSKPRPTVFAQAAYNGVAVLGTGYNASVISPPTFNFAGADAIPAETNVPHLHVFGYCSGAGVACTSTLRGMMIVNSDPNNSQNVNFAGMNVPSGSVTLTTYGSPNISDSNEAINTPNVVVNTVSTVTNPTYFTLAPHSLITLQWAASGTTTPIPNNIKVLFVNVGGAIKMFSPQ